jgi:hypothetical protein
MATTAQFISAPVIDISQITTANTARDGTGTTVLVCSGPTFAAASGVGKRITRAVIQGVTGNSAGIVRFFASNDSGTTKRMMLEKPITATTVSSSLSAYRAEIPELVGFVLPGVSGANASQIYAATHVTDTYNIIIESGTL